MTVWLDQLRPSLNARPDQERSTKSASNAPLLKGAESSAESEVLRVLRSGRPVHSMAELERETGLNSVTTEAVFKRLRDRRLVRTGTTNTGASFLTACGVY